MTQDREHDQEENARRAAIKKIVDDSPPLTEDQLAKLTVLLHGGTGEEGSPA